MKIGTIYPRDIIAIVCLGAAFTLKYLGVDTILDGIIGLVVGYYFTKRVSEAEAKK